MFDSLTVTQHTLECGTTLREVPVAYRSWGRLNARGDNAVVVCHALTASTDAADWWGPLIGPGRVLDTARFFVICPGVPGSPYGSVSPLTVNPETGRSYGPDFPPFTVRDVVALHRAALGALGVQRVALAIGGSLGGMQVLEWGFHSDFVDALVPISVGGRHSAWCIGWTEAQRRAIYADPCWLDGRYAPEAPPAAGLALARAIAMLSYRTADAFETRLGRDHAPGDPTRFAVESYLRDQGERLVARFDANCYVSLTRLMNAHDVAKCRGAYPDVLSQIRQPTLVLGTDSDVLYPLKEQRELARELPHAELAVIHSPYGHDAFLIEFDQLEAHIRPWLARHLERKPPRGSADSLIRTPEPQGRDEDRGDRPDGEWERVEEASPAGPPPAVTAAQPPALHVLKFGGTSVGDAAGIRRVVEIVGAAARAQRVIVVVSALAGVTDTLAQAVEALGRDGGRTATLGPISRRTSEWLASLEKRHDALAASVLGGERLEEYRAVLHSSLAGLAGVFDRLAAERCASEGRRAAWRDAALAVGERLSAPLIASALRESGLDAVAVDAAQLIRTDARHGAARVDIAPTRHTVRQWYGRRTGRTVPVVTGFIGAAPDGSTTTLGRGGSDYTAALLAAALCADRLERWTDIDGLYTDDPCRNATAQPLHTLTLDRAQPWNRAGRLGMHSLTLDPLIEAGIPLCIRSTRGPAGRGTWLLPANPFRPALPVASLPLLPHR